MENHKRKPYSTPQLIVHGMVDEITQAKDPTATDPIAGTPPGKGVSGVDAFGAVGGS